MNIKSFLKLVEIRTKIASLVPFFVGIVFTLYRYEVFQWKSLLIFGVSLFSLDMATTAINNYMDSRRAIHKEGYNYEEHNAVISFGLSNRQVVTSIITLLTISALFGCILVYKTDVLVLVLGLIGGFIGINYSFGPIPLSRTPFGEMFSGIMMGGFIFFVTIYIQIYDQGFVSFILSGKELLFQVNLEELILILVLAMPMVLFVSNIMLANNLCDFEEDVKNRRYTLVYYVGKKYGLQIYKWSCILAYVFLFIGILMNWLPITVILVALTILPIMRHVKIFMEKQEKATTFVFSVQNLLLFGFSYGFSILLSVIIKALSFL